MVVNATESGDFALLHDPLHHALLPHVVELRRCPLNVSTPQMCGARLFAVRVILLQRYKVCQLVPAVLSLIISHCIVGLAGRRWLPRRAPSAVRDEDEDGLQGV